MYGHDGSLPEDHINFVLISQFLNIIDNYEGGAKSEHLLVISLQFNLDPDLQSLFPHLLTLRLNLTSLNENKKACRVFL